jgi:hypothetical protein
MTVGAGSWAGGAICTGRRIIEAAGYFDTGRRIIEAAGYFE